MLGVAYYPEHWPESRWATDARLMREAGLELVRLAEFAWARLEPAEGVLEWGWLDRAIETLAGAGLQVVLGTPTAAPPAWLAHADPDTLPVDAAGHRRRFGSRRHACPSSPGYRGHSRRIVEAVAGRYGRHPAVVGWQLDNEVGHHGTARCHCPRCAEAFRGWLARRYGTLAALNEAWGAVFWSQTYTDWSQIELPVLTVAEPNPSHVLDFFRFASDAWVDHLQGQVDVLRRETAGRTPRPFLTTNLTGLFGELDAYKLAAPLDLVGWDSYPTGHRDRWAERLYAPDGAAAPGALAYDVGDPAVTGFAHDLMRGVKGGPFWVMEQQAGAVNWGAYNPAPRPGVVRLWTWNALGHGADTVVYFRWRACPYGQEQHHGGLLRHDGEPAVGLGDVRAMRAEAEARRALAGTAVEAEVALLHSYEDLWALGLQPHHREFGYLRHLFTYYRALERAGVPVDVVPPTRDLGRYRLVIAPTLFLVDEAIAGNLRRYVEGGGRLLLSVRSGFKTASNRVVDGPPPGLLAPLVGAVVEEWQSLPPGVAWPLTVGGVEGCAATWAEALAAREATVVGRYTGGPLAGRPAATSHRVGPGEVLYLGLWLADPLAAGVVRGLLARAGIAPRATLPPGVHLGRRVCADREHVVLTNFTDAAAPVELPGPGWDPAASPVEVPPRGVVLCHRPRPR